MSINLNDKQFETTAIKVFNGGKAGLVKNVAVSVTKKTPAEADNAPDYKLILTDEEGAELNEGFYYFTPRQGASTEEVKTSEGYELTRLVHLARAVMGADAQLPEVNTVREALDSIMKLVSNNAGGKTFNVFVNYGTTVRPSQYLRLRRFNFIESSEVESTTLVQGTKDNMQRITPDTPVTPPAAAASGWSA